MKTIFSCVFFLYSFMVREHFLKLVNSEIYFVKNLVRFKIDSKHNPIPIGAKIKESHLEKKLFEASNRDLNSQFVIMSTTQDKVQILYSKGQKRLAINDSNAVISFSDAYSIADPSPHQVTKIIFWLAISYKQRISPYACAYLFKRLDLDNITGDKNVKKYKEEYKKLKKWLQYQDVRKLKFQKTRANEDLALQAYDIYMNEKNNDRIHKRNIHKYQTCFFRDSILK